MNIRYVCWLLVAGAVGGLIVLTAQTVGNVPVAKATHLGFVQLGHSNTETSRTTVDNIAPARGDGTVLTLSASPAAREGMA